MLTKIRAVLVTVIIAMAANPYPVVADDNPTKEMSSEGTPGTAEAVSPVADGATTAQEATGAYFGANPDQPYDGTDNHAAIADGSSEVPEVEDTEVGVFDRVWDYLTAHSAETSNRARTYWEKRKMDAKYGKGSSSDPTWTVLAEAEESLAKSEDLRIAAQLSLEVENQRKQELYEKSLMCLALNGFYEARSETADQEVAVGAVVLNRLSVGFRGATTVCEVVMSPNQFSWVKTEGLSVPNFGKKAERQAWERSLLIAKRLLDPDATYIDPSNGAVYYYNPSIVDWKYKGSYIETAVLGQHRFMREKKGSDFYVDNRVMRINPVLFNGLPHDERDRLKAEFQNKQVGSK